VAGENRTRSIQRVFRTLPAGEALTAAEIVEGLLFHGHDFGPAATGQADYVTLTETTLTRMVSRGVLGEGINPYEVTTWSRPEPSAARTHRSAPAAALPSSQRPGSDAQLALASFVVTLIVLGILIPVIVLLDAR
jgi:hypothetical protein